MADFVTRRVRCPVCSTEFAVDEVIAASAEARETDFRAVHVGPDPLLRNIHSCPECWYSAYLPGFEVDSSDDDDSREVEDDPLSLPRARVIRPNDDDVADLRRYLHSEEGGASVLAPGEEPFGPARYLLAARIRDFLLNEHPLHLAHYYLRAAWAARALKDPTAERSALAEVLLRLNQALDSGSTNDQARTRLSYLAGELSRRTGHFAHAVDYLTMVEREADLDDAEGAFLAWLARRQNALALVKSEVNALIPADVMKESEGTVRSREDESEDDEEDDESGLN